MRVFEAKSILRRNFDLSMSVQKLANSKQTVEASYDYGENQSSRTAGRIFGDFHPCRFL